MIHDPPEYVECRQCGGKPESFTINYNWDCFRDDPEVISVDVQVKCFNRDCQIKNMEYTIPQEEFFDDDN